MCFAEEENQCENSGDKSVNCLRPLAPLSLKRGEKRFDHVNFCGSQMQMQIMFEAGHTGPTMREAIFTEWFLNIPCGSAECFFP